MKRSELKSILIHRISEINDIEFLKSLRKILDSGTENEIIRLSDDEISDITASGKDIAKGSYVENDIFNKEVKQWLRAR